MPTLTAEFEVVTPCFAGGERPRQSAPELRVTSILGQIAFWWRARVWNEGLTLAKLKEREAEIFGSTNRAAAFSAALEISYVQGLTDLGPFGFEHGPTRECAGLAYLAGQGLAGRNAIPPGTRFKLHLSLPRKRDWQEQKLASFIDALTWFGLVGGIGARSRRGFGSVRLISFRVTSNILSGSHHPSWSEPDTFEDYVAQLRRGFPEPDQESGLPPYTAMSPRSSFVALKRQGEVWQSLNWIGEKFQLYRSDYKVFGRDLDWSQELAKQSRARAPDLTHFATAPQRVSFGLPQNYSVDGKPVASITGIGRRASPLLFHIHTVRGEPVVVCSAFPAKFLPDNTELAIKLGREKSKKLAAPDDATVAATVTGFLDELPPPAPYGAR